MPLCLPYSDDINAGPGVGTCQPSSSGTRDQPEEEPSLVPEGVFEEQEDGFWEEPEDLYWAQERAFELDDYMPPMEDVLTHGEAESGLFDLLI